MGPIETALQHLVLAVPAACGLYLAAGSAREIARMRRIHRTGKPATAQVSASGHRAETRKTRIFWLAVQFELPDGRIVESDCRVSQLFWTLHPPGAETAIRYLASDPTEFVFLGDMRFLGWHRVHLLMGIVACLMAGVGLLLVRR